MDEKHDVSRLDRIDSKHSHFKDDVAVSVEEPALNEAEQLVLEHDEFTPQEYKKLMLKVDLILMPMLMISELPLAHDEIRGKAYLYIDLSPLDRYIRINAAPAPLTLVYPSPRSPQSQPITHHRGRISANIQFTVFSSRTRQVCPPVSSSTCARTRVSSGTNSATSVPSSTCPMLSRSTPWRGCCRKCHSDEDWRSA